MLLSPGDRLGPYEIVAPLGAGGMGEVYKARDTRLDRTVAIKVSQERFTDRFEREARAISALNHPAICQLYDVGPNYLVMEFVEGAPVARPETTRKLLDLAVQMADGLAAAHTAGIVHRDLKPDNILVTPDGRVKILDFGLATHGRAALDAGDAAPTVAATNPGTVLGTVSYMSPEQARGQAPLTPQSDQFSLGLVLYELAAGRRAFRRDSSAETMAAIIREEPEPLPATAPAPLRWVIERLLAKEPADRYDSTRDLYRELRQIRDRLSESTTASNVAPATTRAGRSPRAWAAIAAGTIAGALIAAAVGAVWMTLSGRLPGATPSGATSSGGGDLSQYTFTPIAAEGGAEGDPSWSPDGKSIAYTMNSAGAPQVFIRGVGSPEAAQVTSLERGASNPSWSPDGSKIYFSSDGSLWTVSSTGGAPERIVERAGSFAVHPDGRTIAFVRGSDLWVRTTGEEPRQLALSQEVTSIPGPRELFAFSPDGSKLAGAIADKLWLFPYPTGPPQAFDVVALHEAGWMPDSRRLVLNRILGPQSHHFSMLDTASGRNDVFYVSPDALVSAAVSPDGSRLAYSAGRIQWHVIEFDLRDRRVRNLQSWAWYPAWSPSGTRYLFGALDGRRLGIEDAAASDRFSRRVVEVEEGAPSNPQWARDGARFTFLHRDSKGARLMISNTSGARMAPLDPTAPGITRDAVWSPDGEFVIYARVIPQKEFQIARIRPGASAGPEVIASWPSNEPTRRRIPVTWSPRGTQILARAEGGSTELFLMTPDFKSERLLTSRAFVPDALGFTTDGRAVLGMFRNRSGTGAQWQLWSVDVATGREALVTDVDLPDATDRVSGFSLHPDGTRFLTSIAIFPFDIWMLEGFASPPRAPVR